jgi:hypothetical protein
MATRFDSDRYLSLLDKAMPGEVENDEILRFLQGQGLSIIQSTIVYARRRGLSMSDAKEIVAESAIWSGVVADHSSFHDKLERGAEVD